MATCTHGSLADFAAESGEPFHCAGNRPLVIGDGEFVWFLEKGVADLFLVERRNGEEVSAPQHLLRSEAGRLIPGFEAQSGDTTLEVIAKGAPGTVLRKLPAASLSALDTREVAEHVDAWLIEISGRLARDIQHRPRESINAQPGSIRTEQNQILSARHDPVWILTLPRGAGLFMDLIDASEHEVQGVLPLTSSSWITMTTETTLTACSSETLAREGRLFPALRSFHRTSLQLEQLNRRLALVDQANLEIAKTTNRRAEEDDARNRLLDVCRLSQKDGFGAGGSALLDTLQLIGHRENIRFREPEDTNASSTGITLEDILDASGVRGRQVRLNPDEKWWIGDSGSMLGFRSGDGQPVALLPGLWGRYRAVDPVTRETTRLTAERAGTLRTEAWSFYPPLPPKGIRPRDILRLFPGRLAADCLHVAVSGLLGCAIMLLPAVILGLVVEETIPAGDTGLLYGATGMLAALALLSALLHSLQGMAQMRIGGGIASRIEAAFWDRVLRLPFRLLNRHTVGGVTMGSMAFSSLRDAVQGLAATSALSVFLLLPFMFLVGFYAPGLGGPAISFGLFSLFATVALGFWQIAPRGEMTGISQSLAGKLHEIMDSIFKLRIEGAEGSAFAIWARDYRKQKYVELKLGRREAWLQAFGNALPLFSTAFLFMAAMLSEETGVGKFLVVYIAFMTYQTAVMRLGASFGEVAAVVSELKAVWPLMTEPLEEETQGEPVGELKGEVLFDHITFRYGADGPLILDDVSIHVRPGEFIAIVGESGSGKSTLFRLALGEAEPYSGTVYYDGRDLKHLNRKQVHRRIGVVPQDVDLHPDDIWDNIVGHHKSVWEDEMWSAAELASVKQDIQRMPMKTATAVGVGNQVLSGGEAQRIMIARALLRKPRILLLDEATNWLDNSRQTEIMENLAGLNTTRIVIAHRLSTLREVDRIYVLSGGKVTQTGTFSELSEMEGTFRNLIRRQIA